MQSEKSDMAGPEIPIANSRLGLRAIARHSPVVLLATEAFGVVAAHAADATWVGGNGGDPMEWVENNNWTPTAVPNGVATFTNTGVTTVANDNGIVIVGEVFERDDHEQSRVTVPNPRPTRSRESEKRHHINQIQMVKCSCTSTLARPCC